jgi:hypothetical protein
MLVKIKDNANDRHQFPDWPWYLGTYSGTAQERKYLSNYEGFIFKVVQDEFDEEKFTLSDNSWALSHLGNKTAWIEKQDVEVISENNFLLHLSDKQIIRTLDAEAIDAENTIDAYIQCIEWLKSFIEE